MRDWLYILLGIGTLLLLSWLLIAAAKSLRQYLDRDRKNLALALDQEIENKWLKKGLSQNLVLGIYKAGHLYIRSYNQHSSHLSNSTSAIVAYTELETTICHQHTIFELASLSKLLTTTLLQTLCDAALLDLEDTLGELIGTSITLQPKIAAITLRQLATHTAGLPRVPKQLLRKANDMTNPYACITEADLFDYLAHANDVQAPGKFVYSNLGMGLLGHVISLVMQQPLATLLHEYVFSPLGMARSFINTGEQQELAIIDGHDRLGKPTPHWTFPVLAGAGAVCSCMSDMMQFVRANLTAPHNAVTQALHHMQQQDENQLQALGWMPPSLVDKLAGNRQILWHNGQTGGFASYLSIDPVHQTGVVVLSNQSVDVTMLGIMLTRLVRTQSWQSTSDQSYSNFQG